MAARRAGTLREDIDLGERVDAFVARFSRLQDTLADKLLPEILSWLGEPVGPAIDNVARAERLGWIPDGQAWFDARQLRNRMIHEVVRDPEVLAAALSIFGTPMPFGMPQEVQDALAPTVPFPSRLGTPADGAKLVQAIVTNEMPSGKVIRHITGVADQRHRKTAVIAQPPADF